ncbi:MAG TPA: acylphosphatase [Candidatus Baltobacteraceae bacterium]|nr:acylphosphatase [Candidatus Baltobacteraceae bacterium]
MLLEEGGRSVDHSREGFPAAEAATSVVTRERIVLTGRVQGVGFRDTILAIAAHHAVAGTVRNLAGGALEIDCEGAPDAIDAFVADVLAHPPPFARIGRVAREPATPRGLRGFTRDASF